EARTTGRGRVVDAAMTDGSALLMGLFSALQSRGPWSDRRGGNLLDGGAPFYRCYACRDGGFIAVGALEPQFYAALIAGLGLSAEEAPQFDMAGWPGLHARFEALFLSRDRDDWAAHFEGTDACVTPVLTLSEAARHPHNAARGTSEAAPGSQPGAAPRLSGVSAQAEPQGPALSLDEAIQAWSTRVV